MNRSYQVYLQNQSLTFTKKLTIFSAIFLLLLTLLYFVGKHFAQNNLKVEKQRQKIEMSSSRSSSLNANREALIREFNALNSDRRENIRNGRQYIIEFLTKSASQAMLSNFVIENISQKDSVINIKYSDLQKLSNIILFEVEITFNSVLHYQMIEFLSDINNNVNGVALVVQNETRKIIQEIDREILESVNMGKKISMIGNHIVLHWFFIK